MKTLGKDNWEVVKWILIYLRGSCNYSLCFQGSKICLQGCVDSYMVGDLDG